MKKIISILFVFTFILTGMHFTLATHICCGEVAAVKCSFSGEKASCGMKGEQQNLPTQKSINSNCCHDKVAALIVDDNYSPSFLQLHSPDFHLLQVFYIHKTIRIQFLHTNSDLNTNVQPPGNYIACAVSLPDICVFRI